MLTPDHKEQRVHACADLLERHEIMGVDFFDSIVTGDETWAHHYVPESKRQSRNGNTRIHRQRRKSRLSHPLEKPCVPFLGTREGSSLWIS
jgi:hypothetical protein